MITRDDVSKALSKLDLSKSGEVSKSGDLGPTEGAAEEGGTLSAPGESMAHEAGESKAKEASEKKKGDDDESKKSFYDDMPSEVEAKVEVSTFLKSLVDHTAGQINGLRDFVVKSDRAQDARYEDLMDSINGLAKSMGNVGIVLKAVCERIGVIENEPMQPKAVIKSAAIEKTFVAMEGAPEGEGLYKSLGNKSPVEVRKGISDAMMELVKKGEMKDTDLINFETFGYVTPEADKLLRTIL
jgi:hypothetical protein